MAAPRDFGRAKPNGNLLEQSCRQSLVNNIHAFNFTQINPVCSKVCKINRPSKSWFSYAVKTLLMIMLRKRMLKKVLKGHIKGVKTCKKNIKDCKNAWFFIVWVYTSKGFAKKKQLNFAQFHKRMTETFRRAEHTLSIVQCAVVRVLFYCSVCSLYCAVCSI